MSTHATSGSVKSYAAVDLGASSGRVMVGRAGRDSLELVEAHRFPNRPVRTPEGLRWDVLALYAGVLDGLILLETNTQPGMTPTSLSPEQAGHVGISFPELCRWIVEDASCNR